MRKTMIPTEQELDFDRKLVPDLDSAEVKTAILLWEKGQEIREKIVKVLQDKYDLSEGRYCTLMALYRAPQGLHLFELADRGGVARATITRILQRMKPMGYVRIQVDEEDERQKTVFLTDKGRKLMEEILPQHYKRIGNMLQNLSLEERKQLAALLEKLD